MLIVAITLERISHYYHIIIIVRSQTSYIGNIAGRLKWLPAAVYLRLFVQHTVSKSRRSVNTNLIARSSVSIYRVYTQYMRQTCVIIINDNLHDWWELQRLYIYNNEPWSEWWNEKNWDRMHFWITVAASILLYKLYVGRVSCPFCVIKYKCLADLPVYLYIRSPCRTTISFWRTDEKPRAQKSNAVHER